MNFTISELIYEDAMGEWKGETSEWTGIIGRVIRREADIGAFEFSLTNERSKIIRYTTPVVTGAWKLYVKRPDSNYILWNAHFTVRNYSQYTLICFILMQFLKATMYL